MLTTQRPTPTTVLYTVSTTPRPQPWPTRLTNSLLILARILTGLLIAVILLIEYRTSNPSSSPLEHQILASPPGQLAHLLTVNIHKTWRLPLCAVILWVILQRGYTEESLLVIRGLGVQTSTSSSSYLWRSSTRFIPTSNVQDIFIHEAFKGFEVKYYLMIVVEGEDELVVVFPNVLPRREILEDVWRGARACLYELKG